MGANIASPTHLLLILVVLLLVFGAKKLPELGRGIGESMREFRGGVAGEDKPAVQAAPVADQPASSDPR
jgi:sec-independent protein translocase protein TatA